MVLSPAYICDLACISSVCVYIESDISYSWANVSVDKTDFK